MNRSSHRPRNRTQFKIDDFKFLKGKSDFNFSNNLVKKVLMRKICLKFKQNFRTPGQAEIKCNNVTRANRRLTALIKKN